MEDTVENQLQRAFAILGLYLIALACFTSIAYWAGYSSAKEIAETEISNVRSESYRSEQKGIDAVRRAWEVEAAIKGYGEFSVDKIGKIVFRWKDKVE